MSTPVRDEDEESSFDNGNSLVDSETISSSSPGSTKSIKNIYSSLFDPSKSSRRDNFYSSDSFISPTSSRSRSSNQITDKDQTNANGGKNVSSRKIGALLCRLIPLAGHSKSSEARKRGKETDRDLTLRNRSSSFTPSCIETPSLVALDLRERSYTDNDSRLAITIEKSGFLTLPRNPGAFKSHKDAVPPPLLFHPTKSINAAPTSPNRTSSNMSDLVTVQCLLPNGIVTDVRVHPDEEIRQIKQTILNHATKNETIPLGGCLSPEGRHYSVSYISVQGKKEEVYNENFSLRRLRPYERILQFTKRIKNRDQYVFRKDVGKLIGKNLKDFDDLRNCEVNDFRWWSREYANSVAQERKKKLDKSWQANVAYQYPSVLSIFKRPSEILEEISVEVYWKDIQIFSVHVDKSPSEILQDIGLRNGYDLGYISECCLKIVGQNSYLIGNQHPLISYQYVMDNIDNTPKFIVIHKDEIPVVQPNASVYQDLDDETANHRMLDSMVRQADEDTCNFGNEIMLSSRLPHIFSVYAQSVRINPYETELGSEQHSVAKSSILYLQMGLYHGGKPLCSSRCVALRSPPDENGIISIKRKIKFNIKISDIPRMAKLSLGIYEKKGKSSTFPLYWANTSIFDYKCQLRWKMTLHLWNYSPGMSIMHTHENALSPLLHIMSNPNIREAADIVLHFTDLESPHLVRYSPGLFYIEDKMDSSPECTGAKIYSQELGTIAERDPLHDLTEQEKDLLWKVRDYCRSQRPGLLPRIIDCVDYSNANQVSELRGVLENWPILPPENALQLLDYAYPDPNVRQFAVKCLKQLSDEFLLVYMLQLVQALKHELFLQNSLVEFLLRRALNNTHVGHCLFWHLKAEMNSPSVGVLFGLLLETYLAAAPEHFRVLENQNYLLEKCRSVHHQIQIKSEAMNRDKSHEKLQTIFLKITAGLFKNSGYFFESFVFPLDPSIGCKELLLEQCRLMNSKMRPLMLSFKNTDQHQEERKGEEGRQQRIQFKNATLMYKRGDDLRQDMLTLQLLNVMDIIWKNAGLDLRLTIYKVLSTGNREGFIEVVPNCATICKIQMSKAGTRATAAFENRLLLSWLREHNDSVEKMKRAQWEFTRSCAAYSVATYILGIGDRHNDNIMIKTNGQLFHIDFGHFLGNFKHKFGIRRERVPMILYSEFVELIKTDFGEPGRNNFQKFRDLCEVSYLAIRREGSLLISLLAMMISTGLPELSSEMDLNIVRNTLHLDLTENEAREQFRKTFDASLNSAWYISVDWWFHIMNQLRTT